MGRWDIVPTFLLYQQLSNLLSTLLSCMLSKEAGSGAKSGQGSLSLYNKLCLTCHPTKRGTSHTTHPISALHFLFQDSGFWFIGGAGRFWLR